MPYPSALAAWIDCLHKRGQTAFTLREALEGTNLPRGAFLDASERLQRKGRLRKIRNGFYVLVGSSDQVNRAPLVARFLRELMDYEQCEYYVAFLMAAAWHGASHHAAMNFRVVADKRLPLELPVGRRRIGFTYRSNFEVITPFIRPVEYRGKSLHVSSPELTLFDLVSRPRFGAGYNNIANVAIEMGSRIDPGDLVACSERFPQATVQRAGYLLDYAQHVDRADALESALAKRSPQWVEFRTSPARARTLKVPEGLRPPPPPERNRRWRVIVRTPLEPDVWPGRHVDISELLAA